MVGKYSLPSIHTAYRKIVFQLFYIVLHGTFYIGEAIILHTMGGN